MRPNMQSMNEDDIRAIYNEENTPREQEIFDMYLRTTTYNAIEEYDLFVYYGKYYKVVRVKKHFCMVVEMIPMRTIRSEDGSIWRLYSRKDVKYNDDMIRMRKIDMIGTPTYSNNYFPTVTVR